MISVLIVDDIKGWRDFHADVLKKIFGRNLDITTAECAQDGYNILMTQKHFDVIITDLQMEDTFSPKLAGEWFVEQVKTFRCYFNTKIVIISASYNVRNIAKQLGVYCIPKSTARTCLSAYEEILL